MGIMFNLEFSWSKVAQLITSTFKERERDRQKIFSLFFIQCSQNQIIAFHLLFLSICLSMCLSVYRSISMMIFHSICTCSITFWMRKRERENVFIFYTLFFFFFFSSRWSNYSIPSFWIFLFDCYIIVCLFIYTFVVVVVFLFVSNVVFLICSHRFSRFGKKNVNTLK